MAGKLTDEHILETTEQFFRTGINSFRIAGLYEQDAKRCALVIGGSSRYDTEVKGPSVLNDPYNSIPLYSVQVTRGGASNA